MGIIFIISIIGLIIYCLYIVHSKRVFHIYEPFCFNCQRVFDIEHTYYPYCPYCHVKIIWRRKTPRKLHQELKEYRERRRNNNGK